MLNILVDNHISNYVHTTKGRKAESTNGKLIGRYYRRYWNNIDYVNFCLVMDGYGQIKYMIQDRRFDIEGVRE